MADVKKYSEIDLYKLLGIEITATEQEIRKSYRKKALVCHPDKNPDNPKAAQAFHELQDALAILMDQSARMAYDRMLRAKKANELRTRQLDSKRQKLKSDLEEREKAGRSKQKSQTPEELFKSEFERIMKENKKLLEEENEILKQQIYKDRQAAPTTVYDSSKHRIKIKWNSTNDSSNEYTKENLTRFLSKYGDIVILLVSEKKKGSGIVEFKTQDAAEMAVSYEKGFLENPLQLSWIGDKPKSKSSGSCTTDVDYESLVLRQMRQTEERKRLIEQMMKEDHDDS